MKDKGQALIEFLLIFSAMIIISFRIVTSLHSYFADTVEYLNYQLQDQLSIGTCPNYCYFEGFHNR